jgi:2-polyprenyl-3-methyl-5-hydroxy-6-metoxy-1,4-benzoquinol methylase
MLTVCPNGLGLITPFHAEKRLDAAAHHIDGPLIPALDDVERNPDVARGDMFLAALKAMDVGVAGRRVADLGSGYGTLALAMARGGASKVLAVDANAVRLDRMRDRAAQAGIEVETINANLLAELPYATQFDVVTLIGVAEYAGLWDTQAPVEALQMRVFRAAHNLLRPGGKLVFASKNRLWPPFAVRDVNTGQFAVNALPRRVTRWVMHRSHRPPYRHYIHTPGGWRGLVIGSGFRKAECFYPYFSYQFPLAVVRRPSLMDVRRLRSIVRSDDEGARAGGSLPTLKALAIALASAAGIPAAPSVIIVASK